MRSTLGEGLAVPDLDAIARERTVLAAVADAIVAASVGKGLRVAVACPNSHLALADYLAQALHARGRACRCLPMRPDPEDARSGPPDRQDSSSTVVMLTIGLDPDVDRGVRRVNISVIARVQRDSEVSHHASGEAYSRATGDSDIIIDYRDPKGPVIRYMAPELAAHHRQ
ncbi:MAG: hypothetical protein WA890_12150 [Micromonospora sp.]